MHDNNRLAEQLVEYQLGLLQDPQLAEFEVRLAEHPELRAQLTKVRNILSPLDLLETPAASGDLVDAIMQRVETTTPLEYVAASSAIRPDPAGAPPSRSGFSMGELVALAACILLVLSVFTPGMMSVRSRQLQAMCANNMASFGRGLFSYATSNDGALPYAGQPQPANWMARPNRMHLQPAIRLRFIAPKSLICPTSDSDGLVSGDGAIDQEAMLRFLQRSGLRFYSIQNPNGPTLRITAQIPMPIASDANPVFENGRFNPSVGWNSNSHAHDGRGQNALFIDGSTRFLRSPMISPNAGAADNIWKAEDISEYSGMESQKTATDTFLTP